MIDASADRRVYRMNPLRRYFIVLAPLAVLIPIGLGVWQAPGARARGYFFVLLLLMAAGVAALLWVVSRVRLELTADGVRLVGAGRERSALAAAWADVVDVRLDRGREALVTGKPLEGRWAASMAKLTNFGYWGLPMYDTTQRALLSERRLIPLDAFSRHLHHGSLIADLVRFAPHLQAACAAGPRPARLITPAQRREGLVILAVSLLLAGLLIWAMNSDRVRRWIFPAFLLFLAMLCASSALNAFRAGAKFIGAVQMAFVVVLVVVGVGGLAIAFRGL